MMNHSPGTPEGATIESCVYALIVRQACLTISNEDQYGSSNDRKRWGERTLICWAREPHKTATETYHATWPMRGKTGCGSASHLQLSHFHVLWLVAEVRCGGCGSCTPSNQCTREILKHGPSLRPIWHVMRARLDRRSLQSKSLLVNILEIPTYGGHLTI